ncbi:TPA: MucBP domain-containing protein, partial [Streptococcus suis]|nr:MucBP domain-containing protein [Streptococcus suis]
KQPVEDTPTSSTGTPYDTTDNKPTTITTEDGKTYRIVPVLTKGNETGDVVEGTTEITYVYEEVKGDVVVEYYDTEGNLISGLSDSGEAVDTKEVDTPSTSTGTAYNTDEDHKPNTITAADGTVYYYKEVKDTSASTTGEVVEGTTTVQYVYEKAGNVIVHYITEDGTVIKATVTDEENAEPGKSYTTTDNKPTTITTEDGTVYELIPTATIGNEDGSVEAGKTIEVTYVYRKVETPKSVVTNHVDEDGNPIAPQEEGTTPDKSIPGYEFTGKTITDEDGNTTHIYKKTPTKKVVTNHVDEEGNVISPQEDGTTPNKGTSIPGYEYVRTVVDVEGNTTHIYRKVSNKPTPPATETPMKPQPATPTPTADKAKQLPNTGEASSSAGVLGAAMLVAAIALAGKRRRNED